MDPSRGTARASTQSAIAASLTSRKRILSRSAIQLGQGLWKSLIALASIAQCALRFAPLSRVTEHHYDADAAARSSRIGAALSSISTASPSFVTRATSGVQIHDCPLAERLFEPEGLRAPGPRVDDAQDVRDPLADPLHGASTR